MGFRDGFKAAEDRVANSGITAAFFSFFQGRATAFAILFTVCGLILAFRGKLDGNYALFITAIQGLVFAHSCKEDWNDYKNRQLDVSQNTTVVVNTQSSSSASQVPNAIPAAAVQPPSNQ